ncbi:MAG: flagellar biosynthesis protein FlhB [Halieaceae bacterium]
MAEETAQERTEEPTAKRREDAKKKGEVPRSRDFNTLVSLLAGGLGTLVLGPTLIGDTRQLLSGGLRLERNLAFDDGAPLQLFHAAMIDAALLLAPLLSLLLVCTLLGPLLLGGWSFSPAAIAPKLERVSPIKGMGRIFSARSLVELVKALLKFLLVGGVAVATLWQTSGWLLALATTPLSRGMTEVGEQFVWCFLLLSSAMIVIALIDVPFQLWDHTRKLRMSRQEIKDEMKESEGRPEVKGHIRNLQQQAAQQRMMEDVPSADVIITNPTHFAVALRYKDGQMSAPIVVAKGRDLVALRIREIAAEHNITIFSAPPLARALHAGTDIGDEIPANLFVAVARVLAYVFQLRSAGDYARQVPMPDPDTLQPPAEEDDQ